MGRQDVGAAALQEATTSASVKRTGKTRETVINVTWDQSVNRVPWLQPLFITLISVIAVEHVCAVMQVCGRLLRMHVDMCVSDVCGMLDISY